MAPSVHATHAEPLRGQWHLDGSCDSAVCTFPDSSGHDLTGTSAGSATSVSDGRFGSALKFPTKPAVVDVGDQPLLQPATVTLLAWVRAGSIPLQVKTIASQGAAGSCAHASYALYTGGSTFPAGLRFYIWNGTQTFVTPPADNAMWDGAWHLAAGTYDGANVRLYVDGQQVGSDTPATGPITYGLDFSNNFTIGNYAGASTCSENTNFSGDVDETRVYSRALSATEIARLAAASGPNPPDLVPDQSAPPPNQHPAPQNVTPPTISALASAGGLTGSYICNPGTWSDLPSPPGFTYRWVAIENGSAVTVATTQQFTPSPAVYGFPITCEVTVQGPSGPVTATSNSDVFSSAGVNVLPPAYGDVRIRGIDVFQVVQPNAGATQFAWPAGGPFGVDPFGQVICGAGTPTNWRATPSGCFLQGRPPQQVDYDGVSPLDADKPATAIVYVARSNGAGDPNVAVDVELSGTLNGQSLGDPLALSATPVQGTGSPWVSRGQRDAPKFGVQFTLPSAWTAPGKLRLTARVRFPNSDFGPRFGTRQCDLPEVSPPGSGVYGPGVPSCDADDTFTVDQIPFKRFTAPVFAAISLRLKSLGQQPFTRNPQQVMDAATRLFPGGQRMTIPSTYRSDIDISDLQYVYVNPDKTSECFGTGAGAFADKVFAGIMNTRSCRQQALNQVIANWMSANPARPARGRGYDFLIAVTNYVADDSDSSLKPFGYREPGYSQGTNIGGVSAASASCCGFSTGFMLVNVSRVPIHGTAHELGHLLTLPHAVPSGACGNNNDGSESWAPDGRGDLQGVRFIPNASGSFPFLFLPRPVDPQIDGSPSELFDLMSYCYDLNRIDTSFSQPGSVWLSARNWNRTAAALDTFATSIAGVQQNLLLPVGDRLTGAIAFRFLKIPAKAAGVTGAARSAANGGGGYAFGPVDGDSARIAGVVVPAPPGANGPPSPDPASHYRLRSLGAGGHVLLEVGVNVQQPSAEMTPAIGQFSGPVAPGAAAVELVHDGRVIARRDRSRPPSVKLSAPTSKTRLRSGRQLDVSWHGSDPDGDRLQATVDFSPDNGRSWRTVFMGPSRGLASIPSSMLTGSRHARVRVGLSDGFADTTATSAAFLVQGNPPQVRIIAPQGGMLRAGDRTLLSATGIDDVGVTLKGKALTWYAGRKRLGIGGSLRARLPAGKFTLKLLARGSNGLTRFATLRVNVAARRLRLVSVSVPQRVHKNAGTVTVTLKMSARSILSAAGRRLVVRTKATKLTIPLPKKPAVGVLKVPFKLSATDRSVKGTISGALWVVRT